MMKTLRVLVVHPEPVVAERFAGALRDVGHDVVVVPDGERAIDRFIQAPSDVIVVEMLLPGRDGATTIESIRWAPGGDRATVILLGTRGTPRLELAQAAERVAALAALPGPPDPGAVRSLLAGLVGPRTSPTRPALSTKPGISASSGGSGGGSVSTGSRFTEAWTDDTTRPGDVERASRRATSVVEEIFASPDAELTGSWETGDDPTAEREGLAVEKHATESTGEDTMEGDLSEVAFPRLLHQIAERRETGALVVTGLHDRRKTTSGQPPKKAVYFRSGVPIYVQSNLVQECLGQVLARGGHISHQVLAESIEAMRRNEGRQGGVLLAMGAITPHQLRDALEDQLRVKLFDLFAWSSGYFRFQTAVKAPPEIVTLEMSLPAIVFKGVVHRIPPQRLLDRLGPHLDTYVVPDPPRLGRFGRVEMPAEAKTLLGALDGTRRLSELLAEAGDRPGAAAQLVYALACLEAVTFEAAPRQVRTLAEEPPRDASGITSSIAVLREELMQLGRLLREERYEEALGVLAGDGEGAVRAATRLRARYHPATEPGAAPRELRALAYEVCARLVHAEQAVSIGGAGRPVDSLGLVRAFGDVPTRDEKSGPGAEDYDGDGPDDELTASPSDSGARPTARPGAPSDDDLRPTVPQRARAGAKPSDEHMAPEETAFSKARVTAVLESDSDGRPGNALELLRPAIVPAHARLDAGDDETDTLDSASTTNKGAQAIRLDDVTVPEDRRPSMTAPSLDQQVERLYQAERHFRRGERALARSRPSEAVAAFERAVELCPDEGEFVAHLGYARYQAAGDDATLVETALAELALGAELAPKLDLAHLLRARVLSDFGDLSAARDAYEHALAANPDCAEALDGLHKIRSE